MNRRKIWKAVKAHVRFRNNLEIFLTVFIIFLFPYLLNVADTIKNVETYAERSYWGTCEVNQGVVSQPEVANVTSSSYSEEEEVIGTTVTQTYEYLGATVVEMPLVGVGVGYQLPDDNAIIVRDDLDQQRPLGKTPTLIHEICHLRQWQEERIPVDVCKDKEYVLEIQRECNYAELNFFDWIKPTRDLR